MIIMKNTKRQMSLMIILSLMLSVLSPMLTYAEEAIFVTEIDYSNLNAGKDEASVSGGQVSYECDTVQDAGEKLREGLKNRKSEIAITLSKEAAGTSDCNAVFDSIYAIALEHTGEGDEGDYLKWHLRKLSASYAPSSNTYKLSVTYMSDASMEQKTTKAVEKVEQELQIDKNASAFEKILIIYDYLAENISYDHKDTSNLPHTAYDAIVNGKAVCQGYATLFYRLLLDYGVDNRIIVSTTHAWNLVGINGEYYECDLTWDSEGVQEGRSYEYFLRSDLSWEKTDHVWRTQVLDKEVSKLARAESDYVEANLETASYIISKVEGSSASPIKLSAPTLKISKKSKSVVLKWSDMQAAKGYYVYRKAAGGTWKKIATVNKTTYTDKNMNKGTYSYRVQAYYKTLKGSYSKTKRVDR
jgi:hypothetical protein